MRKYADLIKHTFFFDGKEDFSVENNELSFHGVKLMPLIEKYGTPLRFTYLPKIGQNINKAKGWFAKAIEKLNYQGTYTYCYCTKSSHFIFVLEEALKHDIQIETSSAFDIDIVRSLYKKGKIDRSKIVLCNGYKDATYANNICQLLDDGFSNCIPILDNTAEFDRYQNAQINNIGIRIATDEVPDMEFYTSRLGIPYKEVNDFYENKVANHPKAKLKLLHFFINAGIKDTVHFWSELNKFVQKYCELKKICPTLDTLDIGGGFPIKTSLGFEYDYEYMTEAILKTIQEVCEEENTPVPNIFTEFGSFTVGESGGMIFSVLEAKEQNDKETWYMIDGSMITHLPDTWGLNQKFIMLAINNWNKEYQQAHIGGRTCDSLDYYTSEMHIAKIMLPKFEKGLYIGFFNMGAYQESVGGYGGIQHCLIPAAKFVLIDQDENGNISDRLFRDAQKSTDMLKLLGYE